MRVCSATRRPRCSAVAMSALWTASAPSSELDWAAAPEKKPRRLRSFSEPVLVFQPGFRPRLIQLMPCCAASVWKNCRVLSLSPLLDPEFVKPAATLSCQTSPNQRFEVASAKTWKAPEAVPM